MIKRTMDKIESDKEFKKTVIPLLRVHGYIDEQINKMVPRVRFGKDYKNWSIRIEDRYKDEVPLMEQLVRIGDTQKLLIQAFVSCGKVLSYSITYPNLLAHTLTIPGLYIDVPNRIEGVKFRCIMFNDVKKIFNFFCCVYDSEKGFL
jgi:hypothetical protein